MLAYNGSIPGPTLRVPGRLRDHRPCRKPRRPRCHRPLARPAAREPLRRHARDAGADPGRRPLLRPSHVPRPRPLLVPPAHPRGLRPGDGAVRQRPGRAGRPRLLAAGQPRGAPDARRHPARGGQRRAVQPRPRRRYSAMGRFGDVLLVGGETDLSLGARLGEVVRFYLTNTANTRVFKVALPGARMKLVGGDSGHVEHEQFVDDVVLAPSERVVVDVLFDQSGRSDARAPHARPHLSAGRDPRQRRAGRAVTCRAVRASCGPTPTWSPSARGSRRTSRPSRTSPSAFIAEMDMGVPEGDGPVVYACPMHPEVVSEEPGHCPEVRDEAAGGRGSGDDLYLPDAPRGGQRGARATARNAG